MSTPPNAMTGPVWVDASGNAFTSADGGKTFSAIALAPGDVPIATPTAAGLAPAGTPFVAPGAALTNADATINPGTDLASQYILPASVPLTGNRVLTLGTGGTPVTNSVVSIWKLGAGAFTYTVKDDAATTLLTFASGSTKQLGNFYYNGTHWVLLSLIYTA